MPARRAPRPPRGNGAKTREKLVAAAAELFNEVGYFGTDTNRIARAAGYAPATFYKHFADKREIFLATYEQWVAVEWEGIRGELAASRRGRALASITRRVLEHHRRWVGFRRSLRALAATDPIVQAFRISQRQAQLDFMTELLTRRGGKRPSPSRCLLTLLCFERVCDAVADGEVAALGIAENALLRGLEDELRAAGAA